MDEQERKKWLLSLSEEQASSLSKDDWYDRGHLLKEKIGMEIVRNNKTFSEKYSKDWGPGHPSWDSIHGSKNKNVI